MNAKPPNSSYAYFRNEHQGLIYTPALVIHETPLPTFDITINGEAVKEMPLWGTNLPPEVIQGLNVTAQIETIAFPPFAEISIQLRSVDGDIHFETQPEPSTTPEPYRIKLPRDELLRFNGKDVDFSYLISVAGGQRVVGDTRRVHIRFPLQHSLPVIEGVTESGLIVANYPNGLVVDLSAVKHLQTFNDISCVWNVVIEDEKGLVLLYCMKLVVASTEKAYRFRIPAEAYTGYPPEAYATCGVDTNLFPRGASNWSWGFGGNAYIVLR